MRALLWQSCSLRVASRPPQTSAGLQRICQLSLHRHGRLRGGCSNGARCFALFKFGADKKDTYASRNGRDDYKEGDVEDYFNYMGMLAAEGNYDRLEKMLQSRTPPVDLLLLMAASENDAPKIAELLRAGANTDVRDTDGKTAKDLTESEAVLELLADREKAFSF